MVNRETSDPLVISDPLVNIAGALPPDVLDELADHRNRSDGFLDNGFLVEIEQLA